MKKESIGTIEGCPINFLRFREHYAAHSKWDPFMASTAFLSGRLDLASNLYRRDLFAHYGCVNAIEFSQEGCLLISGGDDRRVLLWNLEESVAGKFKPVPMKEEHSSNIFCLAFDSKNVKIFSAGNDEQVIVHDVQTGETLNAFMHEEAIYGVSVNPYCDSIFASAGEDGQVLLFDTRAPIADEPLLIARSYDPFHAVQFHPNEPKFLITANPKEGVVLWDIRKPRLPFMKYGDKKSPESSMCAKFNGNGSQIIALRRRLPPILYNTHETSPICQFDADHYYNSCTMKSCCFAGSRDQYVLSGSDDFNLYMWRIPDPGSRTRFVSDAHLVLKGHRSIVNQVRFNPRNFTIASSGVEKIIKLWSTVPVPGSNGNLEGDGNLQFMTRRVYTHEEYIGLVLDSGQNVSHDYSHGSTAEDPRMMAFFDSLVQREVEGWTTNTDFSDEDVDTTSNSAYSFSTVPTTDDSDSDCNYWSQARTITNSSLPSLPLRKRRILKSRRLRCNMNLGAASVANVNESSEGEKPLSPVRPTPGSDWILRLIAKKRAQLKAAKRKRKHGKKKQKNKSKKFIRCLTSNSSRPRSYHYKSDNYSSVAMTRSSTSPGGELLRRRHVVAPYTTVMTLSSYVDSEPEEESSDHSGSEEDKKSLKSVTKVSKMTNLNPTGEGTSGLNQGKNKTSNNSKRKAIRLWSSESSSSSNEGCNKKIVFKSKGRKRILPQVSSDSGNSLNKTVTIDNFVTEPLGSDDSNDDCAKNGVYRTRKNYNVNNNLPKSDIGLSDYESDTNCSTSTRGNLKQTLNAESLSDIVHINSISVDKSGSILFDLNKSQRSTLDFLTTDVERPNLKNEPDTNKVGIPLSKSSQSAMHSLFKFYNKGLLDDGQGLVFISESNAKPVSHNSEACQSDPQNFVDPIKFQPHCSLVNSSFKNSNYNMDYSNNKEKIISDDKINLMVTPEKNIFTKFKKEELSISVAQSHDNGNSCTPDSGICSSVDHTPDASILISDDHASSDSRILNINISNKIENNSKFSNEEINHNPKLLKKACEISFKKKVSDCKMRKYRSRSSGDDM